MRSLIFTLNLFVVGLLLLNSCRRDSVSSKTNTYDSLLIRYIAFDTLNHPPGLDTSAIYLLDYDQQKRLIKFTEYQFDTLRGIVGGKYLIDFNYNGPDSLPDSYFETHLVYDNSIGQILTFKDTGYITYTFSGLPLQVQHKQVYTLSPGPKDTIVRNYTYSGDNITMSTIRYSNGSVIPNEIIIKISSTTSNGNIVSSSFENQTTSYLMKFNFSTTAGTGKNPFYKLQPWYAVAHLPKPGEGYFGGAYLSKNLVRIYTEQYSLTGPGSSEQYSSNYSSSYELNDAGYPTKGVYTLLQRDGARKIAGKYIFSYTR